MCDVRRGHSTRASIDLLSHFESLSLSLSLSLSNGACRVDVNVDRLEINDLLSTLVLVLVVVV